MGHSRQDGLAAFLERVASALARSASGGHGSAGTAYPEIPVVQDEDKSREELLAELQACRDELATLRNQRIPASEKLFGGLLEAAPDAIVIVDEKGVIRLVNPQAERLFGYEPGELTGQPIEVLVPKALRGAHTRHRQGYGERPVARRMGIGLKLTGQRKDGTEIPAEISLSPLQTDEGRFIISAIRDVTERREAEGLLQRQAEELRQSNDQLEQFAYVASHDLQEPLRMVSSYLQLLQRRYKGQLDDNADEFIAYAVDGARRMQALINDLLVYSRVGTRAEPHAPVDLAAVVQRVLKDQKVLIEEAEATVHVDTLPTVYAENSQMVQLFSNLLNNALKFRRPEVPPEIRVQATWQGERWVFRVTDNGIGIDPDYRGRIFQIFQRLHTRQEYPGTGIGLAICKRIVERHGGSIQVEATPGGGATFVFDLPHRKRPRSTP